MHNESRKDSATETFGGAAPTALPLSHAVRTTSLCSCLGDALWSPRLHVHLSVGSLRLASIQFASRAGSPMKPHASFRKLYQWYVPTALNHLRDAFPTLGLPKAQPKNVCLFLPTGGGAEPSPP